MDLPFVIAALFVFAGIAIIFYTMLRAWYSGCFDYRWTVISGLGFLTGLVGIGIYWVLQLLSIGK